MIKRNAEETLRCALTDNPVVFVNGARQTGKSTLVKTIPGSGHTAQYITFDDVGMLAGAKSDPVGFLHSLPLPVVLDEVQRVPDLFLTIKAEVDRSRKAGRFLLTGSANVLLLPHLADSLAGRMEIVTLWPFSQGELIGRKEDFIDMMFSPTLPIREISALDRESLIGRIVTGGYPGAVARTGEARRTAWFGSYVTTILQRDVRDLARIEGLTALPRLLTMLAARSSTLLNVAQLSNSAALPQSTLRRYLTLLETTYLIKFLPAWSGNLGKRLMKTPKVLLCDTGVLGYLLGINASNLFQKPASLGSMLETFVTMEISKQITWSVAQPTLYHFRTLRGQEVDLVLEHRSGKIVGIEVKSGSTAMDADFKNLRILADIAGKKFHRGVVLYIGSDVIPFGTKLHAVPIQSLWA